VYGNEGGQWKYGAVDAVNFTDAITPGNGAITLGSASPGTTKYTMYNAGNNILTLDWEATNFTLAGASFNWSLKQGDTPDDLLQQLVIDDDHDPTAESGDSNNLSTVAIYNKEPIGITSFNHTTGLQLCYEDTCDPGQSNGVWNESIGLYFTVTPPTGLAAGTYTSTITYTLEDCDYADCEYDSY
jgi:hypothetical protein